MLPTEYVNSQYKGKEILNLKNRITRMTTFIKTKFNISDDQTNIDKYRLVANIIE